MLLFYFDRLSIRNQAKSDLIQIIQVAGVQILLGYDYMIEVDRCIFFPNLIHQWTIKLVWNVDMTLMIGIFFVVWILDSCINITIRNWDWVLRFLLSKLLAMMIFLLAYSTQALPIYNQDNETVSLWLMGDSKEDLIWWLNIERHYEKVSSCTSF